MDIGSQYVTIYGPGMRGSHLSGLGVLVAVVLGLALAGFFIWLLKRL